MEPLNDRFDDKWTEEINGMRCLPYVHGNCMDRLENFRECMYSNSNNTNTHTKNAQAKMVLMALMVDPPSQMKFT
jgi:histidine ammonia-lyase